MKFACAFASLLPLLTPLAQAVQTARAADWVEHPAAVQAIYQSHVPHTDRTGRPLKTFDADRSFFPLALYHALHGEVRGRRYDLADYRKAGFNAVHFWERQSFAE